MVTIYFTNGRMGRIRAATDVQQMWSHVGIRGHLVILCVDESGAEIGCFPASQIICYQVETNRA